MPRTRTRAAPLHWRLSVLAASGLLPLAFMVALALGYLLRENQQATQQSALALSRALATAIDAELRSTTAVLRAISENDELQTGRFEAFYHAAAKVAAQQGWLAAQLSDAHGHTVFRTDVSYGTATRPADPESIA
ncbi:MAG TPA: hypothetical protein VKD22_12170, partial [Ramlibacter sp.]|nr:hypothetical protein [Ramlibacter sp.]